MTDNTLWMILLVVMLVCIVLSMGLPSTALYIVVAVAVSPILIKAGVMPLAAHFFCLLVWRVIQYYSSGRPSELYGSKVLREPIRCKLHGMRYV